MRRQLVLSLVLAGGAVAITLGIILLGRMARDALLPEARFSLAVEEIDCLPPPGMERIPFLHEVQYVSRLPDRVRLLDNDLQIKLGEAFARHPWVEEVEEVRVAAPSSIRVRLRYRIPVLVVMFAEGSRVVDGTAMLLPGTASQDGLPKLQGTRPLTHPSGRRLADSEAQSAAAIAGLLHPHQGRLAVTTIEHGENGVLLHCSTGRIVWGSPPGKEQRDEPSATQKLQRLLEYNPSERELDLRKPLAPEPERK